jgi:hypothetical protein
MLATGSIIWFSEANERYRFDSLWELVAVFRRRTDHNLGQVKTMPISGEFLETNFLNWSPTSGKYQIVSQPTSEN